VRTLYIDIETSPMVAYAWRTFKENIGVDQIIEPTRVICAAWQWGHEDPADGTFFHAEWYVDGHLGMVEMLHSVLDEADVVVHYNGASFDVPHLNREFMEAGLTPPSPFAQVDLYKVVSKMFRFTSNRLAHVSDVLKLGPEGKLHTDFSLWKDVLAGDKQARLDMQTYNMNDVVITRELHEKFKPWVPGPPNAGLYADSEEPICVSCGSSELEKRGFAYTSAGKFQRFQCQGCGRWMRGAKRESTTPMREARL